MKTVRLLGTDIADEEKGNITEGFADISYFVRKGHNVCGDSALVHVDDDKAVMAVLDGVSGEPGAGEASSVAAIAILNHLKGIRSPKKEDLQEAFVKAAVNIVYGLTTAAIAVVTKDGRFICGSVGDSVVYSLGSNGGVKAELATVRLVGGGTSLPRFLMYRNMVPSALGMPADTDMFFREGSLENGDCLLLMTDGVIDNLAIKVKGELVVDPSGVEDLAQMVAGAGSIESVVGKIRNEVVRRMDAKFDIRDEGKALVAKTDDLAVIGIKFTGTPSAVEKIRQPSKVRRTSKKRPKSL